MRLISWLILALFIACPGIVSGDQSPSQEELFQSNVLPLLQAKCMACHGPEKQEGGLRLDSRQAAIIGGDNGPAIVPGQPDESPLIRAARFTDPELQMPPNEPLSPDDVSALVNWVAQGAIWPEPVLVLFEDEPTFVDSLISGKGRAQLITEGIHAGQAALSVTPIQRFSERIPGWSFLIRENPREDEYRYLQLAWKKTGPGAVMVELATSGRWPDAQAAAGRYVSGENTSGWAAITLSAEAPTEWTVVTLDLWKELGDVVLTGIAPTCIQDGEAFFDSIVIGPTIESVTSYRPGLGTLVSPAIEPTTAIGDALTDANNPIRKLWKGERLDLWSLRTPERANPPAVENASSAHPIDAFIEKNLRLQGLGLSNEADRRTLIRRLSFDLTGLPPTPKEVDTFVADNSSDAYDQLVDRLLESPRYGERQARLWLDLVRYADTHGFERDEYRPLAWQYRDYVVRAFNQDKPFNQFTREQLAGDELVDGLPDNAEEADALIAAGYLQLGQWDSTASIFQEEDRLRADEQADLTNTTAAAFLGLTMSCCQCHDHKYDPFSQADHYRLRAFFAGVERRNDIVIALPAERETIAAHNAAIDAEVAPLRSEVAQLDSSQESDKPRLDELNAKIADYDARKQHPRVAMSVSEAAAPPATYLLSQGDFRSPKNEVPPGFVSVLLPAPAMISPVRPETSGRRSALADWILSRDNPWTARVFVNRIWQQHFGIGLVATPNDFGYSGARPTNQPLLDWLAIEFVENGWSVKQLHRLIVTSAAYRQASIDRHDAQLIDPENSLLWRQNIRRLDAETLRDSLLSVAGQLREGQGGKPKWPQVPEELLYAQPGIQEALKGEDAGRMQGWFTDPPEELDVRSLYLVRKRCLPIPFLQAFDLPDTTVSCARRDTTVVAPQALMLLNSDESIRYAQALADRVRSQITPTVPFDAAASSLTRQVFREALCRIPDSEELALSVRFLQSQRDHHQSGDSPDTAEHRAIVDLCRGVLNLNEFAYYD